jgi:hypothetical protein
LIAGEMKLIVALAFTIGTMVLGAGVAHADNDSDHINNLKSHGLFPSTGTSESQWETSAINAAHEICGLAAAGYSRNGIKVHCTAKHPDNESTVNVMVDAAMATYCPEYWG